jgi:hypothetical protein
MMKIINSLYVCVFELSEKSISQTCKFFTNARDIQCSN